MNSNLFESLFAQWYKPLCRFALRMVGDPELAEDVVQEVFVKFWERRDSLPQDLVPKAYLYKAVYNACLNAITRQKRTVSMAPEISDTTPGDQDSDLDLRRQEVQKGIDSGLEELPPACKQVFELSRFEEMSYKEIAETMEISPKTVEAHMSKALRILRKHLMPFFLVLLLVRVCLLVEI